MLLGMYSGDLWFSVSIPNFIKGAESDTYCEKKTERERDREKKREREEGEGRRDRKGEKGRGVRESVNRFV